ncbi:uncharacterized protein RHOBADRAFT_44917 [Rhodotorula graminis WP1]|uniref:Uncharacterized protein n=1 Tax=Rhodotorula graminis (strain WP1) TaxID=578459 RepID=A0A194S1F3_RHOGW|nr:uncharacterized protein RHOBADRAFT_44917 [Rhodotorula graminis WP1]KPV74427.1 hypothetical protein RHOBADRAFT_44917 [Rhodotorula graminis WP1]
MSAEKHGVELSLESLVSGWIGFHPDGERDRKEAERWLRSMVTLLERSTLQASDWALVEKEVDRYREYLVEGHWRNLVKTDEASMQHALPILSKLAGLNSALAHARLLHAGTASHSLARRYTADSEAYPHGPSHYKLQRSRPF